MNTTNHKVVVAKQNTLNFTTEPLTNQLMLSKYCIAGTGAKSRF